MSSHEFKDICRICLDNSVVLNWNDTLFEYCDITYKDCYYKYSQLKYLDPDPFSPMLCQNCLNGLQNAHTLVLTAIESYSYFQEKYFNNLQIDDSTNVIKYPSTEFETVLIEEIDINVSDEQCEEKNLSNVFNTKSESTECSKSMNPISQNDIKKSAKCKSIKQYIEHDESNKKIKLSDENKSNTKNIKTTKIKNEWVDDTNEYCYTQLESKKKTKLSKTSKQNNRKDGNNKKLQVSDENKNTKDFKTIKLKNELLDNQIEECDTQIDSKNQTELSKICLICSKVSHSKRAAKIHAKIHMKNRERKETCKVCGLKLYNKSCLYEHMRIHNENREKKHKCDFCNKAFYNKGGLNIHRRLHLGQMIPCSLCPKEFFRQIDLERHMTSHSATMINSDTKTRTKTKYYVLCKHCDKSILSTNFKSHTAAHLNTPLMKCSICNKEFFSRGSCVSHMRKVHKKKSEEYDNYIILYTKNRLSRLFLEQTEEIQLSDNK